MDPSKLELNVYAGLMNSPLVFRDPLGLKAATTYHVNLKLVANVAFPFTTFCFLFAKQIAADLSPNLTSTFAIIWLIAKNPR